MGKLGEIFLREAVEFFLRHNRADVPRRTLVEIAEQFAKSREQSGLSAHYVSQCRKTVNDLAKAFPGKTLPDLRTVELDAWLGGLTLGAKTKNGMRIILVACEWGKEFMGRVNLQRMAEQVRQHLSRVAALRPRTAEAVKENPAATVAMAEKITSSVEEMAQKLRKKVRERIHRNQRPRPRLR